MKAKDAEGTQAVMSSAAGGGAGGSATLMSIYKNYRGMSQQIIEDDKETEFAVRSALASADVSEMLGKQSRRSGEVGAASDLIGGARGLYTSKPGNVDFSLSELSTLRYNRGYGRTGRSNGYDYGE